MKTPAGTKLPPEAEGLGPLETWQVWASSPKGKQGVVEVTAPRDMLPYAVVREAYRCRLQMDVVVSQIKGGVNLTATPFPPSPAIEKAVADQRNEAIGYVAGLDSEERAKIRKAAAKSGTTVVFEDEQMEAGHA